MNWVKDHAIFSMMDLDEAEDAGKMRASQLIASKNSLLFAWNNTKSCLYSSNSHDDTQLVQTLLCDDPPLFEVRKVVVTEDCSRVALIGTRGVSIMLLPKRIMQKKDKIICKTVRIAERFFVTNISVQLLQASWHPTRLPYLFILSSDNTLRLYDVTGNPQCTVSTYNLNQNTQTSLNQSITSIISMYSTATSLGESAVAFDFGEEIECDFNSLMLQIYVLKGNGDVLLLLTQNHKQVSLLGPVIMLPQADDNYGTDSCSILVTKTQPQVIVIGTKGKLHHCIATTSPQNGPNKRLGLEEDEDLTSLEPVLYVYETVQLEIIPEQDECNDEYFVDLFGDPRLPWRYFSCTCVGVHSISLPWLQHLSQYFVKPQLEDISFYSQDEACVVEHVLCTKPTVQSKACTIRGLTIFNNLSSTLLCLTNDHHCTAIPLLSTLRGSSPGLLSDECREGEKSGGLTGEQDFHKHITNILRRDSSQPILRSGGGEADESGEMIARATSLLREQYMHKQSKAQQAIVKRIQLINEQKQAQKDDIDNLRKIKYDLTETAGQIANDYEDMKERQEGLMVRISNIIKSSKLDDPVLSTAEVNMGKELRKISDQMRKLDNSIKQLKIKHEYQQKQITKTDDTTLQRQNTPTSALHHNQLKQILLEEGDKIHELIKKVNNMNLQVGL